jgi:hypothetical protein
MEGRIAEGLADIDAGTKILDERCTGVMWELDTARIFGLWALIYLGRFTELRTRFQTLFKDARERGDRYMESTLGIYPGVIAHLIADQPEEARDLAAQSIAQWSQSGCHVQHETHMLGEFTRALYEGRSRAAWERVRPLHAALRGSLLWRIQQIRVDNLQLAGRLALANAAEASAGSTERGRWLTEAERFRRRLESEQSPWGAAFASLIAAGAANLSRQEPLVLDRLRQALTTSENEGLGLLASIARHSLGERLGGDEGAESCRSAADWFHSRGVANPARLSACFAPALELR